jgi:2,4-dienoyl-CoA reductase-like NADH-dependent reductase (Old Yellow Enzyme family)
VPRDSNNEVATNNEHPELFIFTATSPTHHPIKQHPTATMSDSRLFKPLKVGNIELQNRVAMAPLTR